MLKLSLEELSALNVVLTAISVEELIRNAMENLADSEKPTETVKAELCCTVLKSLRQSKQTETRSVFRITYPR